jgi:1-deoxy-D-xylulose-5-phosphate synthase
VERLGKGIGAIDVLHRDSARDVLLVVVGAFAPLALQVAARAGEQGYGVTVVDPRWFRPVPERLLELAAGHRLVVSLEDGVRAGSFGTALAQSLTDAGVRTPLRDVAVPVGFHPFGSRSEILADLGLTAQDVARRVVEWVASTEPTPAPAVPAGNGSRKRRTTG